MLIAKHLPSAKDARIYMSVERTYLAYIRLSLYTLSFAVSLRKLEVLADITQRIPVSAFLENVAVVLSIVGTFLIIAGIIIFHFDIKYIEGGIEVSPKETIDPRIYMAVERTFLAWIRTSIALIVFGFVIEKFEFFLQQLEKVFNISLKGDHSALAGVGIFIIFIGLFTLILGTVNFYRTIRQVDAGYYRTNTWLYKIYGAVIFFACLLLTLYVLKII